jgi:predicted TIM-barrel fold metal-dependent hydrolase
LTVPFIVDAHVHTGYPGGFFSPEVDASSLIRRMDQFHIQYALNLCSIRNLLGSTAAEMEKARAEFERWGGRLFYCGYYDPRRGAEDLELLEKVSGWSGFRGIKIHPSLNKVAADDERYDPVWKFAADHDLPIVAHSWSVSSYNPVQFLSTPDKFEFYARKYPQVRFVLAHSGGRGEGRREAVRMIREYDNVYMDFAGDIYCYRYFETLYKEKLLDKILYGSDYPWVDQRSHLSRVYLADIPTALKRGLLRDNAMAVYRLE